MTVNLPTEFVLGAPLQTIDDDPDRVVAIRAPNGELVELKRIRPTDINR
ncbi:hypothetical protein [Haladaptatus cibarius]|nr:hypothetical protein [Haladaptatus cibarius]